MRVIVRVVRNVTTNAPKHTRSGTLIPPPPRSSSSFSSIGARYVCIGRRQCSLRSRSSFKMTSWMPPAPGATGRHLLGPFPRTSCSPVAASRASRRGAILTLDEAGYEFRRVAGSSAGDSQPQSSPRSTAPVDRSPLRANTSTPSTTHVSSPRAECAVRSACSGTSNTSSSTSAFTTARTWSSGSATSSVTSA